MDKRERRLINVRLDLDTIAKLKRLAASERRSMSNYIYALIDRQPEPGGGEGGKRHGD